MAVHNLTVAIADTLNVTAEIVATGPAGPAGANGTNGTNGTNGADGAPGSLLAGTAPNLEGSSGEYWASPAVHTTLALVVGRLYTKMVYVPRTITVDRIGAAVTTGAASSTITLGICVDNGFGDPGAPLVDAGTIDGNSATAQEKTISQVLTGGSRYHLAALCQGGTPTVRADDNTSVGWNGRYASLATATGTTSVGQGRFRDGVSGTALPNPAATTGGVSRVPVITVRIV